MLALEEILTRISSIINDKAKGVFPKVATKTMVHWVYNILEFIMEILVQVLGYLYYF
jgi:hypothetical protein